MQMMPGKKENCTASTIDTMKQMAKSCKVVLTKLTPAQIAKYTRYSLDEAESSEEKKVINKSRKRKHTPVVHFNCEESNSSDLKCVNKGTIHNLNMTHSSSKKNPSKKSNNKNHRKIRISTGNENCTESYKLHSQDLSKTIKCPLNHDCLDSCYHKKRRNEFDDHCDTLGSKSNKQIKYENVKQSGTTHVSTTINLNFFYKDYKSCKEKRGINTVLNSTHETGEESLKNVKHNDTYTSHKLSCNSSKDCDETEDKQLDKSFFKLTKTENTPIESSPKIKIKTEKCCCKSFEKNTESVDTEHVTNKSIELTGLEKIIKPDIINRFQTLNRGNENTINNNHINLSILDPNHKIDTAITEIGSEICNLSIANGVPDTKNKASCCMTIAESVANIDSMTLCDKNRVSTTNSSKEVDTMIIDNDRNVSIAVNTNKIGKIRVKDPQSLGIQSFGSDNSIHFVKIETSGLSECTRRSAENMSVEELVSKYNKHHFTENDIAVFRNYKKHFNDLIESKLPKMGELLHLAVADFVSKDERTQRSEKLSSSDLIKQEKLVAEMEFSDVLQQRGAEFTVLLETTVHSFDKDCAEDMMLALYCRILDMFLIIDKQNKKHVVRARYVLHKMLHKSNYKNEVVCKILSMKGSDFSKRLSRMSHYVLMYNNVVNTVCGNIESKTQLKSTRTTETNAINENTNAVSTKCENISNISKNRSNPDLNLCNNTDDTNISLKLQHNVYVDTLTSETDQHNALSTRLSNLSISGTQNNSILNPKPIRPTSFITVVNKQITHNYDNKKNNTDSKNYINSTNNEAVLNYSIVMDHKTQTNVSTHEKTINNLQHCKQAKNMNRIPFTQIPVNWKTEANYLRYSGVNYMSLQSSTANQNSSSRHITQNNYCSYQNQSYISSAINDDSAVKIQINKVPMQKDVPMQRDINVQNIKHTFQQSSEMLQGVSSYAGDCQQAVKNPKNQPPLLPYIYSPGPELLQKILSNLNTSSAICPEGESVKKIIEDSVCVSKHPVEVGNGSVISRPLMHENERLQATADKPHRTLDRQNRSFLLLPKQFIANNSNGNSVADINTSLSKGYIQKVSTANKNLGKISQQQIYQTTDTNKMKNYQQINVPLVFKSATHKFIQTVTVDKTRCKTQNTLPVISDVFSCRTPTSSSQDVVLPIQESITSMTVHCHDDNNNNNNYNHNNDDDDTNLMSSNNASVLSLPATRNVNDPNPVSVYSNKYQTILESNTNNINPLSSDVLNHSIPSLLPYDNTSGVSTQALGNTVLPMSDKKPVHLPASVLQHLPRSVFPNITQILPIIGDNGRIIKFRTLTCTRSSCNQKSKMLCSVCKKATYCSFKCQSEDWYDGHLNVCYPR